MTLPDLDELRARRVFTALDVHFATVTSRLFGETDADVRLAAALASRAVSQGNACLDLTALRDDPVVRDGEGTAVGTLRWPEFEMWSESLAASPMVSVVTGGEIGRAPLVLEADGRLYLERYWRSERRVAASILARAGLRRDVDPAWLTAALDRLGFPPCDGTVDRQRLAAALAAERALCIVSGGPGTGKTYTVAKILALLAETAEPQAVAPRIALLAPTGKAAARLSESISAELPSLDCSDAARRAIPSSASTIHRALGMSLAPRRRQRRELHADIVVVDEASMIDLQLLDKLLAAIPLRSRLLLLGDRNQLASVEAGTILADLCTDDATPTYSQAQVARLAPVIGSTLPAAAEPSPTIADCVVELTENRRYRESPGIATLAAAIHDGDEATTLDVLRDENFDDVRWIETPPSTEIVDHVCREYEAVREVDDPALRLRALNRTRVLCAHRNGSLGVAGLNAAVENELARRGLIEVGATSYDGRPLLIERNDYSIELFNGDVGLLVKTPAGDAIAVFAGRDGLRYVAPSRLPQHSTVFAMTVHKSQGSEFDEVAVVLPRDPSPVVSRELLYTAVTRARRRVTVYAPEEILRDAVRHRVRRSGGLRRLIWEARSESHRSF